MNATFLRGAPCGKASGVCHANKEGGLLPTELTHLISLRFFFSTREAKVGKKFYHTLDLFLARTKSPLAGSCNAFSTELFPRRGCFCVAQSSELEAPALVNELGQGKLSFGVRPADGPAA